MTLTDEIKETCSFIKVIEHPMFKEMFGDGAFSLEERMEALASFCEAFAFVLGVHPLGRFAHFEDAQYVATETSILESFPGDEPREIPVIEFIVVYVASNVVDEGTPVYINNFNSIGDPNG
jgi:hypothetical protein